MRLPTERSLLYPPEQATGQGVRVVEQVVGETSPKYDVCLSFATEQRTYVAEVARLLRDDGVAVFYDGYETADLLGRDLYTHLRDIYGRDSRYCVIFASADYARKVWPNHERASAQERALFGQDDYVLPVRFDDTEVPGLLRSALYVDARDTTPAELTRIIRTKLSLAAPMGPKTYPVSIVTLATDEPDIPLAAILVSALSACRVSLPPALMSRSDRRLVALLPQEAASRSDVVSLLLPAIEAEVVSRATPPGAIWICVDGGVVTAGDEWSGRAVVDAAAMADAPALPDLRHTVRRARLVFVLSQRWYQDVIHTATPRVNPADYQAVELSERLVGWVRVPGYPKLPVPSGPRAGSGGDVPHRLPTGDRTNNFFGDATIGRLGDDYHLGGGSDGR